MKAAAGLLILWLGLLSASACYGQGKFSQAPPISALQFFGALKEVSLDLRSEPSLAKLIPVSEQQAEIAKVLANRGIVVRPNAPVTLLVTVTHRAPVIEERSVSTGQIGDSTAVQGIYILSEFFVKAVALRNGKLHLVRAAPAVGWAGSTLAEDSGIRKLLLGDQTRQDTRDRFPQIFDESLKAILDNPAEGTPWIVNSWTETAKAAADAEYAKLMTPGTPVDKSQLEGLNSTPEIYLTPNFNHDDCKADPGWNNSWARVFQRLGWTGSAPPRVSIGHFFSCVYAFGLAAPRYFAVSDMIYLQQSDLVFQLNGKPVRAWGELLTAHHEKFALEDTITDVLSDFIPRNIQDFLTDLVLGNGPAVPVMSSAPQTSSGSALASPRASPAPDPPKPQPSVARTPPRPHPAPIIVGKVDVTHLAGLIWGDTREYVASVFGPQRSDYEQDSNAFGGYPHTRSDGLSIRVNYDDNLVTSLKVYTRGSAGAADPLLDLLGKSESAAIALLGSSGNARIIVEYRQD